MLYLTVSTVSLTFASSISYFRKHGTAVKLRCLRRPSYCRLLLRVFSIVYTDCGDSAWERIAIETVTPQQINSFYCTKPNDSRRQFDDFPLSSVSCTELLPLIHLYSKIDIRPTDAAIATQRSPLV